MMSLFAYTRDALLTIVACHIGENYTAPIRYLNGWIAWRVYPDATGG